MSTTAKRTFEVKPRGDRILVKKISCENVSVGGIVLPNNNHRNMVVEVVAVGNGDDVKDIDSGDLVIVDHLSESNQIGGDSDYIVDEFDVIAHYQNKG